MKAHASRDYLVQWKYAEALRLDGQPVTRTYGTHSGGLMPGDRMFMVATKSNELYLLGLLEVKQSRNNGAQVSSLSGVFRIVPLKKLKWQLRFEETSSPKLTRDSPIAMQVRARRKLSSQSTELLAHVLSTKIKQEEHKFEVLEGKTTLVTLSKRERDPKLRSSALARRGTVCEICSFDFAKTYGEFAENCVQVHHIKPLSTAGHDGVTTTSDDVLVICPNCHSALHRYKNPSNWKAFQKACGLGCYASN